MHKSFASTFELLRVSISSSSSRIFPVEELNSARILSLQAHDAHHCTRKASIEQEREPSQGESCANQGCAVPSIWLEMTNDIETGSPLHLIQCVRNASML
eukprot:6460711-Amphidinium_carterae.1